MPEIKAPAAAPNAKGTVLVTGGSGGIGSAIAKRVASDGHAVAIAARQRMSDASRLAEEITQAGGRSMAVRADLADGREVEAAVAEAEAALGPLEAVVHCAAPNYTPIAFAELTWDAVQSQIEVQVKGAFHCAQSVLPRLLERGSGSLVFIGSTASDGAPPAQQTAYVVAKSGLAALARCLAVEYGPRGIRVNVVAPGMTLTDMIANIPEKAKMLTRMQTPLRRLADPSDIAGVVAFLLSPAAGHVTGQTIRVSGGSVMA